MAAHDVTAHAASAWCGQGAKQLGQLYADELSLGSGLYWLCCRGPCGSMLQSRQRHTQPCSRRCKGPWPSTPSALLVRRHRGRLCYQDSCKAERKTLCNHRACTSLRASGELWSKSGARRLMVRCVLHTGMTDVRVLLPASGGAPLPAPQSRAVLPHSCAAAAVSPAGACLAALLHQTGARAAARCLNHCCAVAA